jgi:mannose/cellobiose epimerase-like protein (N-acyl-D-glucosamine 2-epimerase family)
VNDDQLLDCSAFCPVTVRDAADAAGMHRAQMQWRRMLLCVLRAILERSERPAADDFVDTKLEIATGRDFDPADPLRGRQTVYTWIQGRALEALAEHLHWIREGNWLADHLRDELCRRTIGQMRRTMRRMEQLRRQAGGRVTFMMRPDGVPLRCAADGGVVALEPEADAVRSMSELFYFKGLFAAAAALDEQPQAEAAQAELMDVLRSIDAGRFVNDQMAMGAAALPSPAAGCRSHAGRMIGLGAAGLLVRHADDPAAAELGGRFIRYILDQHTNIRRQHVGLEAGDMWEFIDADLQPLRVGDALLSDPGHSAEFVGLALKFLRMRGRSGDEQPADDLRRVLFQSFANGRCLGGPGLVKSFDLLSRRAMNQEMPWWSLPETLRAALETARVSSGAERAACMQIAVSCSNLFLSHYVQPGAHLMAIQTLAPDGTITGSIPATPDADPGYHTGISFIDADGLLEGLLEEAT